MTLKSVTSYQVNQDYLQPTADWSLVLSHPGEDARELIKETRPGTKVEFQINGRTQLTGFVGIINQTHEDITISGQDVLGPAVGGYMDPTFKVEADQSILDVVTLALMDYGFELFIDDAQASITKITGKEIGDNSVSAKTSQIEKKQLEQLQSKPGDTVFGFLERILKRFGFHLSVNGAGTRVVVDRPTFDGSPLYQLSHRFGPLEASNNILKGSASLELNYRDQPSCLVASGKGGGREFGYNDLVSIAVNELTGFDEAGNVLSSVQSILDRYPGASVLPFRDEVKAHRGFFNAEPMSQPVFIVDENSLNQDQLDQFTRRRLSEMQQGAFSFSCSTLGHTGFAVPFAINTLAEVIDDELGIDQNLWIKKVSFSKSRTGGTRTDLSLILPYTLELAKA